MTNTRKSSILLLPILLAVGCIGLSLLNMYSALLLCLALIAILTLCGWSTRLLYFTIFTALTAYLVMKQGQGFVDDPGIGWHLESGRLIASTFTIPHEDPFLFSPTKRNWISDQWLADLAFFHLYNSGGWYAVYAVGLITFICIYLVCIPIILVRVGVSETIVLVTSALCLMMGLPHFVWRPVLFGNLFFSVACIFVLGAYHTFTHEVGSGATSRFLRRFAPILPILFAVWANMHPSFIVGLTLLALLPISLWLDRVILHRQITKGSIVRTSALFLICSLATLINPYGIELHQSIITLLQSDLFMSFHEEWQPIRVRLLEGELFELSFILFALALLLTPHRFKRIGCFSFLSLVFFAHGALQHARMISYFSIVAAPLLALSLSAIWSYIQERARAPSADKTHAFTFPPHVAVAPLVTAGLLFVAFLLNIPLWPHTGISQRRYPYAALEAIRRDNPAAIIYSNPDFGGFITLQGGGALKAVLDDRNTLLGEQMYRDYLSVSHGDSTAKDIVKNSGATHLLIRRGEPFEGVALSHPSLIMFQDDTALVVRVSNL